MFAHKLLIEDLYALPLLLLKKRLRLENFRVDFELDKIIKYNLCKS